MTEDTSVDGSLGSYEIVDVVKEDQIQLSESHRQSPSEPRRYSPSQSHHPSVKPTECSSGVSFVDGPKVEELAENLMLATQENERYRMAMEDCNRVLSKEVEAAETRRQETEHLKNQLASYKETNKGLEDRIRDLESQLLNTTSRSADETDHSIGDANDELKEKVQNQDSEIVQLKQMNYELQNEMSQYQQQLRMAKENNQSEQLQGRIDVLQSEMEKMTLSQSNANELQREVDMLKMELSAKDREISTLRDSAKEMESLGNASELQREVSTLKMELSVKESEISILQGSAKEMESLQEFQSVPTNKSERISQQTKLYNKLEAKVKEIAQLKGETVQLKDAITKLSGESETVKQLKSEISKLAGENEALKQEKETKLRHHSNSETNLQLQIDREAAEKKKYQSLHSQLTEQNRTLSEEFQSIQRDLQMKTEALQRREQECTQLRNQNESLQLDNQQMGGELNTTGKSLEQTLDSLKKHRQEKESMNSTIVDLQNQTQQLYAAKSDLEQQLQNTGGEKGQLLHQLQEIQQEKDRVMKQFDEHVAASNETNAMLNHNLEVSQKETADLRAERETIIDHNQRLSNKLQEITQELNEAMSELSKSVQDLESAGNRSKMLEAELRKINGYYTQVNQEKNQLQGVLEEKMRELRENETTIHAREQNIKENNDMMELLRNQIQQYSRDYEEERVSREKFAQQFNKMQATLKDKDAEIDSLQDLLAKNATTRLKTGPDLNTSVGGDSHLGTGHSEHRLGGGGSDTGGSHWSGSKPGHWSGSKPGHWSGNKEGQGLYNTQASTASSGSFEHEFTTTYPPHPGPQQTMGHPNDQNVSNSLFTGNPPRDNPSRPPTKPRSNIQSMTTMHNPTSDTTPYRNVPGPPGAANIGISTGGANNLGSRPSDLPPPDMTNRTPFTAMNPVQFQHQSRLPYNEFSTVSGTAFKEEVVPCPLCGKQFSTTDELVQHAALCC